MVAQLDIFDAPPPAPKPREEAAPPPSFDRKYRTAREAALELLSDLQWQPWSRLKEVAGVCYPRRLLDLQRLGYRIERRPLEEHGNEYRLVSLQPGEPKGKKLRVYLNEGDAAALAERGEVTAGAVDAVGAALKSFRANKEKL